MSEHVEAFEYSRESAERLDKFLVHCLPQYSRARLQSLIADGRVTINDIPAKKSGQLIESQSRVEVRIPEVQPARVRGENIPLSIVFENEDLIVINKPAGMVVHPAAGHAAGTVVNAVLGYAPHLEGIGGEERPGVVHRLDKDTSGLLLLAKNDHAHRWLQDQFRLRQVEKTYLALVDDAPRTPSGRVEARIGRDPSHRKQMAILRNGKGREAISEYKTLESFAAHTLLEFHPLTGRTHQIRLHCAMLGCPIVGDTIYGRKRPTIDLGRHFLHATKLSIILPGETTQRTFSAPLPADLEDALNSLRKS